MSSAGLRGIEPALGRYDFDSKNVTVDYQAGIDGKVMPSSAGQIAFSFNVFPYIPRRGVGLKRGKSVRRVRGYFDGRQPTPERALAKVRLICQQLEGSFYSKLHHIHVYRVIGLKEFDYYAPTESDALERSMVIATHDDYWKEAECYIIGVSQETYKCAKLSGGHIPDCEMLERGEYAPHGLGLRVAKDKDLLAELKYRGVAAVEWSEECGGKRQCL